MSQSDEATGCDRPCVGSAMTSRSLVQQRVSDTASHGRKMRERAAQPGKLAEALTRRKGCCSMDGGRRTASSLSLPQSAGKESPERAQIGEEPNNTQDDAGQGKPPAAAAPVVLVLLRSSCQSRQHRDRDNNVPCSPKKISSSLVASLISSSPRQTAVGGAAEAEVEQASPSTQPPT